MFTLSTRTNSSNTESIYLSTDPIEFQKHAASKYIESGTKLENHSFRNSRECHTVETSEHFLVSRDTRFLINRASVTNSRKKSRVWQSFPASAILYLHYPNTLDRRGNEESKRDCEEMTGITIIWTLNALKATRKGKRKREREREKGSSST